MTQSSAVRCGSSVAPADATADEAEAGMNPTLYVPNPIAGWEVPSRRGIVGQSMRDCFCSGVWVLIMLREVVVGDDEVERPIEEATKLAIVRLDTAAEGLGSDAVQRMVPSIAVATIFILRCALCMLSVKQKVERISL